jgi:glycosyltransferase involved in cell wall biosynthesis
MLRISWGCHVNLDKMNNTNGYGYATDRMVWALQELGYHVEPNDATADVHIHFDQPHWYKAPSDDIYQIMYHPWESTQLKPGWVKAMNKVDEVWTPSPLIAEWYRADGVDVPVFVYPHGVDKIWSPKQREFDGEFKFLHLGAEAARKGGLEVMRAMRKAFPKRDDVTLTLKMIADGWKIPSIGKTTIVNRTMKVEDLVSMFHDHHAYVYPSWGEGFGLTPLQAMATGMPTITVPAWAQYDNFLDERLSISSDLRQSSWKEIHPGFMFAPHLDDMVDRMRWVVENYESAVDFSMAQTDKIFETYDWISITKSVFADLEKRLNFS